MPNSWADFHAVIAGRANAETRLRVAQALDNPNSELNTLLSGARATTEWLVGPMSPVLRISAAGFVVRQILFWSVFILGAGLIAWSSRSSLQRMVTLECVMGLLAIYSIRETAKSVRELPFAGRKVRGTLVEFLQGVVFIGWGCALISIRERLIASNLDDFVWSYVMAIPVFLFSGFVCISRGMGHRERIAEMNVSLRELFDRSATRMVMLLPWVLVPAWWTGNLLEANLAHFGVTAAGLIGTSVALALTVGTSMVTGVMTSVHSNSNLKGTLLTALTGSVMFFTVGLLGTAPVAGGIAWLLGGSLWIWGAIGLFVAMYVGFTAGATEGNVQFESSESILALRIGFDLLVGVVAGAVVGGVMMATLEVENVLMRQVITAFAAVVSLVGVVWIVDPFVSRRLSPDAASMSMISWPRLIKSQWDIVLRDGTYGLRLLSLQIQLCISGLRASFA